ncbi:MAG: caspase family protein [Phycisphaeraceae bacterium]|nr:caspase family protein [Phycisphaeraceae bacterium]
MKPQHVNSVATVVLLLVLLAGSEGICQGNKPDKRAGVIRSELVLRLGHENEVVGADLSPDGRELATSDSDGIIIWDASTGHQLAYFKKPDEGGLRFSPNGQHILQCTSNGRRIKLLDRRQGKVIHLLKSPGEFSLGWDGVFASDGQRVFIGANHGRLSSVPMSAKYEDLPKYWAAIEGGIVQSWNTDSGKLGRIYRLPRGRHLESLALSTDDKMLAVADKSGWITIWDTQTGNKLRSFCAHAVAKDNHGQLGGYWNSRYSGKVAFHPDGVRLLTAYGNTLTTWNLGTGTQVKVVDQTQKPIRNMAISSDGRYFGACTESEVILYDGIRGKRLKAWNRIASNPMHLGFSADGKRFIFSKGGSLGTSTIEIHLLGDRLAHIQSVKAVPYTHSQIPIITSAVFDPEGKKILVGMQGKISSDASGEDGSLTRYPGALVWDLETHRVKPLALAKADSGYTPSTWWSSDRSKVVYASNAFRNSPSTAISIRDLKTGEVLSRLKGPPYEFVVVSEGNRYLLTHERRMEATIWDVKASKIISSINLEDQAILDVKFIGDGSQLLMSSSDGLSLWDTAKGAKSRSVGKSKGSRPLMLSHDQEVIYVPAYASSEHFKLSAVDLTSGKLLGEMNCYGGKWTSGHIATTDASQDGKQILTAMGSSGNVKIWDASTYKLIHTLEHGLEESGAVFSPDGNRILVYSRNGILKLFDAHRATLLGTIVLRRQGLEWVVVTPTGYFHGSPELTRRISWRISDQLFPLELYSQHFHKPQIISDVLQRHAGETLLVRPVISTPPRVQLEIASIGRQSVQVSATARGGTDTDDIADVHLYVNGRDVEAIQEEEINIKPEEDGIVTFTHRIMIPAHKTKSVIAAVVTDSKGVNSLPSTRVIVLPGEETAGQRKLYVLTVGVSKYMNEASNLKYCHADAEALATLLRAQKGLAFDDVRTRVITDQDATVSGIKAGLDWLRTQCTRSDTALVLFSGHGSRGYAGELYYVPYEAQADAPGSYLPWDDVAQALQGVKASPVLFLADCCHSGAFGSERLSQDEFARPLLRDSRVMVFSSSRGVEASLEMPSLKHGAFTYAVLQGLSGKADLIADKRITISELQAYVANQVKQITEGRQHPSIPLMRDFDPETVIAYVH